MSFLYGLYNVCFVVFFFFKQKTAYEMRISDWSSDVCSSDLPVSSLVPLARSKSHGSVTWMRSRRCCVIQAPLPHHSSCPTLPIRPEAFRYGPRPTESSGSSWKASRHDNRPGRDLPSRSFAD